MKLTQEEAAHFFKLMWPVQFFVNRKLNLLPEVQDLESYIRCTTKEKMRVREALYENIHLLKDFIEENPQNLIEKELGIVAGWKHFRKGDFYMERFLKTYAVFIDDKNKVYGVLGLNQSFDELVHKSYLPLRISTVLLPFQGKIVYDGLFQSYNVFFGRGIANDLKEIYLAAKQKGKIITSLEPGKPTLAKTKPTVVKSWEPELRELMALAAKLKGGSGQPPLYGPAFSLVRASLEFASLAVSGSTDAALLEKGLNKLDRVFKQAENVVMRMDMDED
jgi:hypothetical protein